MIISNKKNNQKGFSLFVTIAISSALLVAGLSVSAIVTRGLEFANVGRESQKAFFAADAGLECALYYDVSSGPTSVFDIYVPGSQINCGGNVVINGAGMPGTTTSVHLGVGGGTRTSVFYLTFNTNPFPVDSCVYVYVTKEVSGATHISSFGRTNCSNPSSRRVERGVEISY